MRLFSWLGQLVHGPPSAETKSARRMWARLACRFQANCMPIHDGAGERWSVEVIDISRGGFRIRTTEPVEVGACLSVETSGDAKTTVLAYVVRVTLRPQGDREVGCAVADDAAAEEWPMLGGERTESPAAERRRWERATCLKEISFQVVGADHPQ